jgi:hypothetical protein
VWDGGDVVLARGGTLVVSSLAAALAADARAELVVPVEGSWPVTLLEDGGEWRSGPLPAGARVLQVRGRGVAARRVPFDVRAGETTRLELALEPGVAVAVRALVPEAEAAQPVLRVRAADGALVLEQELARAPGAPPRQHLAEIALAPGDYSVEASLASGARVTAELRVPADVREVERPLTLDLR